MESKNDHATEFVCTDCGNEIIAMGYHDGDPVCGICRFIRGSPDMPEDIKAKLRGHDDF